MPQLELLPDRDPPQGAQPWRPTGAIPPDFRNFGKFFDTSNWRPGDLILTRELQPDFVGRWIQKAQAKGGYAADDARWSHAAMYIGDGLTVCEATFSFKGGVAHGVVLTQLWDYCFGDSAIRIRRPTLVSNSQAHLLVINAMTHLRKPYAFRQLIKLGFRALTGRGFWSSSVGPALFPAALVCSTLYADAFARLTRRVLGEQNNGHCTPAYLSHCSDFQDVQAEWLPIKS